VWWIVAALMAPAYCGAQVRSFSSAPHWAREKTGGMALAACAVSRMAGVVRAASAALVPGSMRSSFTSVGWAPERVASSACTPVLGPVHSGAVPPRSFFPDTASGLGTASSMPTWVQLPQPPDFF
jgi:hypothetical protein